MLVGKDWFPLAPPYQKILHNGPYEIDHFGNVRRVGEKGMFAPQFLPGYEDALAVYLMPVKHGEVRPFAVAELVLRSFTRAPKSGEGIVFIDGDPYNTHFENLKWSDDVKEDRYGVQR